MSDTNDSGFWVVDDHSPSVSTSQGYVYTCPPSNRPALIRVVMEVVTDGEESWQNTWIRADMVEAVFTHPYKNQFCIQMPQGTIVCKGKIKKFLERISEGYDLWD